MAEAGKGEWVEAAQVDEDSGILFCLARIYPRKVGQPEVRSQGNK